MEEENKKELAQDNKESWLSQNWLGVVLMGVAVSLIMGVILYVGDKSQRHSSASGSLANNKGFVAFDTARYMNARQASMLEMMNEGGEQEEYDNSPVLIIKRIDKLARPTIEKIANGRTVVVKQAFALDGQVEDITDQVLEALDLPKVTATIHVPQIGETVSNDATRSTLDYAREVYRLKEEQAHKRAEGFARDYIDHENEQFLP